MALIDPWTSMTTSGEGVVLRRFVPRVPLRICALHSAQRPPSRLAAAMLDEVVSALGRVATTSPFVLPRRRPSPPERDPPAELVPFARPTTEDGGWRAVNRR